MDLHPRVLVAPDSFKGSLGQAEAAAAIAAGVRRAAPGATVIELPLSDGGEGWLETLVGATADGRVERATVTGPLGEPLEGRFGLIDGERTAVIEVATASGLQLVEPTPATFRAASTAGTGALIGSALDAGARRILVGLGGSATTDGGAGLAVALGARLLDVDGEPIGASAPGNEALADIAAVDLTGLDPRLAATEVLAATDVDNPLLGPTGAAAVYGPQKGAGPADVGPADAALANFAARVEAALDREPRGTPGPGDPTAPGPAPRDLPGAGAAGGLGFGLVAFCGARLASGIELALDVVGFDAALAAADLVITGEGRIDLQTLHGKVVAGVAGRARTAGVPAYAIGGAVDPAVLADWPAFAAAGLAGVESTLEEPLPPAAALAPEAARVRLTAAAERLLRTVGAGPGLDRG
ncbi:MAG TPA: glycerate kinase [Solirubrobacterales bacterium]|jgi:glycerate kinase